MTKIVEIYPDAESVKLQVKAREKFGWKSSVEINSRGVYEVTFTRDESKPKNQKLKALEDDFLQCSVAQDYIERYNGVEADKKQFKAFSAIVLIILIYFLVQLFVLFLVPTLIKVAYTSSPDIIYELGISVTVGEESAPLTPDWKTELNAEELGLSGILTLFGITDPVITVDVEFIVNLLFYIGMAALLIFVLILIFMIRRAFVARTFYKAEVEYIERRKDMLSDIYSDLDSRMDEIMLEVENLG